VFIGEVSGSNSEVSSTAWLLQQFFMVNKINKIFDSFRILIALTLIFSCSTTPTSPSTFYSIPPAAPLSVTVCAD
jgi:hypothetical protein